MYRSRWSYLFVGSKTLVTEVTCSYKIISLFPQLKVTVIIAYWIATQQSLEHDCMSVYIVSSSACTCLYILHSLLLVELLLMYVKSH